MLHIAAFDKHENVGEKGLLFKAMCKTFLSVLTYWGNNEILDRQNSSHHQFAWPSWGRNKICLARCFISFRPIRAINLALYEERTAAECRFRRCKLEAIVRSQFCGDPLKPSAQCSLSLATQKILSTLSSSNVPIFWDNVCDFSPQ